LYSGDGLGAWTHVDRQWRALERSLVLRIELVFTESLSVRVRSAAAAASATADTAGRASLLRIATREMQRLRHRRIPAAQPLADLVEAGISRISGQEDAAALLKRAIERFGALDMPLHAAAARRRLGELTGGDSGQQLIDAADAWMYSHGIRNPE